MNDMYTNAIAWAGEARLVRLLIKCPQHFFSLESDYPETLLTAKYGLARVRSAWALPTEKKRRSPQDLFDGRF